MLRLDLPTFILAMITVFQGYQGLVDGGDNIKLAHWHSVTNIIQLVCLSNTNLVKVDIIDYFHSRHLKPALMLPVALTMDPFISSVPVNSGSVTENLTLELKQPSLTLITAL